MRNGIDGFIGNQDGGCTLSHCVSIANSGSVGSAFFHPYSFIASDHVTGLKRDRLDAYAYLFMLPLLSRLSGKYGFNREINGERIARERILLPIQDDGMPDWHFMSAYMRQEEARLLVQTLPRLERQLAGGRTEPIELPSRPWRAYRLLDLFEARRGNQNHMAALAPGFTPLISAKKWNNGVKDFVEAGPRGVFPRHCITLNNDGDGGAGLAFYQPFSATVDSHVTVLLPRVRVGRGALLFAVRCLSAQRAKYGHGYSISRDRLRGFRLMLPTGEDGNPNWDFMEAYMRREELEGLARGLGYFKGKRK